MSTSLKVYQFEHTILSMHFKTFNDECTIVTKAQDTCDFQQCGILTSVDSDEPVQPPFKRRNSELFSVIS